MANAAGLIIAVGIAVAVVAVGFAVADHVQNAPLVEFETPQFAVRSHQQPMLYS